MYPIISSALFFGVLFGVLAVKGYRALGGK